MPAYRASFLFEEGTWGWSETFFREASSFNAFAKFAALLFWQRVNILANHILVQGMRVSVPGSFRDVRFFGPSTSYSMLVDPNNPNGEIPPHGYFPINLGGAAGDAVEENCALLTRLEAGETARRMFLIRGIPEEAVSNNNVYDPFRSTLWIPAYKTFKQELTNTGSNFGSGPWTVRAFDPAKLPVLVTSGASPDGRTLIVNVPTLPVVTIAVPANVVIGTGAKVRLWNVKNCRGVNGLWTVANITANTSPVSYDITLRAGPGHSVSVPTNAIFMGAKLASLGYVYLPIDSVGDLRLATRKTGRPFGLPRGRRRPQ